jgi:hypothetical protein
MDHKKQIMVEPIAYVKNSRKEKRIMIGAQ